MLPSEIVAENLRKYRSQHNLTQKQVAAQSGLTQIKISRAERNGKLDPDQLARIAATYKIGIVELFSGVEGLHSSRRAVGRVERSRLDRSTRPTS